MPASKSWILPVPVSLKSFVTYQNDLTGNFFYFHSNPDVARIQERLIANYLVEKGKDSDLKELFKQK